jgi:heterodisulfide reductase subunit A
MSKYLIVGGGISGCTAAGELARLGHEVTVLEQAARFGGKVLDYCCKATDSCSRCGVCVAVSQLHETAKQKRVHISTGSTIREVRWNGAVSVRATRLNPYIDPGLCIGCDACLKACPARCIQRQQKAELVQYVVDYAHCRLHKGKDCAACVEACPAGAVTAGADQSALAFSADALLVATGHQPFDAARKIRLGYGRFPGVMTGTQAEELLSRQESLGSPSDSVAFIQCVGSRDPKEGNNYCSAVCCAYALRLARILKYRHPQADISLYYIDLQNFDKTFTRLREELTTSGIRFIRAIPFRVEQASSGKLELYIENPDGGQTLVEHDRVVLSVGMEPDPQAAELAKSLGLGRNEFGFFAGEAGDRLFVTGTCAEPQSIPDSMSSARAMAVIMGGGTLRGAGPAGPSAAVKRKAAVSGRGKPKAGPKAKTGGTRSGRRA